ncbi:hypothetical protein [Mesorhizobium ventifaucium]|uniref:DUF3168 domain-containing protein n=1 Tax=Mesorhizobium ventifaucium TaxID=666020 RepID=A0ABN8JTG5_9HYPH|nr:hypothetical protein [Mesorhizobium ventifaucium]CAH2399230.1 conserved hypothetical protein [Mesorhizobium ventifaucium]
MASPEAFDVVVQQIADQWGGLTDVVFENDPYELPDTPTEFVYVEVFGDFFDQVSIGAELRDENLWREAGQIYLHVMTPNSTGSRRARVLAKQLVGMFRGQDIDSVTFRDASIGAGDPGRTFANYYAMTATVNFERDE